MADGFDDLEQGFFAAAPPEVPEPPPEPARFDDLVPLPPRRTTARARLRRLRVASATRRVVTLSRRTWRTMAPALRVAREVTLREVRAGTARLVTLFPAERPARRAAVAAVATLIFVMGLSAGVVASRDSAPIAAPAEPARPPLVAKSDVLAVAVQPTPAPVAAPPMAPPSSESIARAAPVEPRAVPQRPHHRRIAAKKPVLAKATKSAPRPTAGVAVPAPRLTAGVAAPAPRPTAGVAAPAPRPTAGVAVSAPRPTAGVAVPAPRPTAGVAAPAPRPTAGVAVSAPRPTFSR